MKEYILGLDPSLTSTGYCVMDECKNIIELNRIIGTSKQSVNKRIYLILDILEDFVYKYNIHNIVMEDGFCGVNKKGSLNLAKLRGAIVGTFGRDINKEIKEYEPSEARKNLGLKGNATKDEVANYILQLYPELLEKIGPYSDKNNKKKTSDMYDAVGICLSHLNQE